MREGALMPQQLLIGFGNGDAGGGKLFVDRSERALDLLPTLRQQPDGRPVASPYGQLDLRQQPVAVGAQPRCQTLQLGKILASFCALAPAQQQLGVNQVHATLASYNSWYASA
jgi:hypothetical protein